ncbi:hypothetical protein BKG82_04045 [Mycobacteroides chelonae]|uniref:Uncharacterized protein n=1 Tax=Mycobacteroides chelonae TaxID=1774 RepID=A0A1S1LXE0_MYCCH|nr:hypothetical protein AOT87_05340 [Mycobacteroides sp. H003]KRQ36953.1 hypothetical protein AOT91_02630 [Mycobacteroides sp. H092]KRQ40612.1 hypothetical protein AOT92_13145 [Mycobacteroides sp. H101]KRQ42308.1 hypothetical protein AOT88_26585 [Mycobacteroides sp. H063]KRQ54543.1 hypothetical protein AOT94_23850 [Mycobacteroides sp. HXVII]KRQ64103.1 hypothetical protein AOT90_12695 [Mycobacteroides sp. H079]KRQ78866.1 hypothetical protein AOT95_17815 [Mycobacteroides sp. HXXIII]KRQ84890.1 
MGEGRAVGIGEYIAPEDFPVFRLTQLMILLQEVAPVGAKAIELERLGYYDFFAANPFAIFGTDDELQHAQLHQASFDERQLSYASTGSRFANRRKRLQHDVAVLVAYRLAQMRHGGYEITSMGQDFVESLTALYVDQYRQSVRVVHSRLRLLSDNQLSQAARGWLKTPSLLLDLYGSVNSTYTETLMRGGL